MTESQKAMPVSSLTRAQQRARSRAVWVFCLILLAVLILVVGFDRDHLAGVSQPIIAVFAGLLAGLMTFFLSGDLGLQLSWLKGAGGFAVFAFVLLFWPKLLPTPSNPGLYRVRITILGPQGEVLEDSTIRSAPGGEIKKVKGGWELDIPTAGLPDDDKLTVYVEDPNTTLRTKRELILGKDLQPTLEIQLSENRSAIVHGRVLDETGNPVSNVRISIVGFEGEAVATTREGGFTLAAHTAPGHMVRLRAEKPGFHTVEQDHPAGESIATVVVERQVRDTGTRPSS